MVFLYSMFWGNDCKLVSCFYFQGRRGIFGYFELKLSGTAVSQN